MICKHIVTCKSVLDAIVGLRQKRLYNNNDDISLVHWVCAFILYHQNLVKKSSNCARCGVAHGNSSSNSDTSGMRRDPSMRCTNKL